MNRVIANINSCIRIITSTLMSLRIIQIKHSNGITMSENQYKVIFRFSFHLKKSMYKNSLTGIVNSNI